MVSSRYTCGKFSPNSSQSDNDSSDDGAKVVEERQDSEAEGIHDSDYDFDDDSEGSEDEF